MFPAVPDEQRRPGHGTHQGHHADGHQQHSPAEGRRCGHFLHRLEGCALEDGHIADTVQIDFANSAGIVGGDGVTLHIAAGSTAGVGGHGSKAVTQGVAVQGCCVVRLPVDGLEGQGPSIVLDGLGDVGSVLIGQVGIGPGGGDLPGAAAVAGDFHLDCVQLERQGAHVAVLRDELLLLRQQCQDGGHVLIGALEADRFRVLSLVVFRQFLPQQICQSIVETILLKVRPGDARGIVLRSQVIELSQLGAILTLGDSSRVADLHLVRSCGQGCGGQCHRQAQHSGA